MERYSREQAEAITRETFRWTMDRYQRAGVHSVRIKSAHDSCAAGKELAKNTYRLNEVPELPYKGCTHELGCRCAPAIDEMG